MKLSSLVAAIVLSASLQSFAQESAFPFRQDSNARESFLKSQFDGCRQGISYGPFMDFCQCYARALADIITGEESEALAAGQIPENLHNKLRAIGSSCKAQFFR